MTNEMKLRFAYAEIARLKKDIVTANREQIDFFAHDQVLQINAVILTIMRTKDIQYFLDAENAFKEAHTGYGK